MPLTLTLDLEDSTGVNAPNGRWVAATERFLEALTTLEARATVFVVGDAAKACPAIVRKVADAGHEIALHGLHHVPLGTSGAEAFPEELRVGKAILEDIAQTPVVGFRAPIFSLTPTTSWAISQLTDADFLYSSSILPAQNPLHGWPGVPTTPFQWSTGLLEFPCPVLGIGPARVPFLGGIYLRYVPLSVSRRHLRQLPDSAAAWSYVHPYDFDHGAPISRFPHANWPTSLLLHTRRKATLPRLTALLAAAGGAGLPLATIGRAIDTATLTQVDPA